MTQAAAVSTLGAPPVMTLGAPPAGMFWWGLSKPPQVAITWGRAVPSGQDGTWRYMRMQGVGGGRTYLFVQATPLRVVSGLAPVGFFYLAAPPKQRAAGGGFLGEPPPALLGEPPEQAPQHYDGAPDRPYPPSGDGWFETTYSDDGARSAAASMLGDLPVNTYTDRLLSTGLYRLFAFEGASGAKQIGALRYWGEASTLGQQENLPNPNSNPAIAAAQTLITWLSQNGCPAQGTYVPEVAAMQTAYNATGIGPAITIDGDYGPNSEAAMNLILNSVVPPAGPAPANCYGTPAPATPGLNTPSAPGGGGSGTLTVPTVNVQGRDYYDTLSDAQQTAFRAALYAHISPATCPGLDFSTITSADGLIDPGNRSGATGCYQLAHAVGTTPGVLDLATYQAVMGETVVAQAGMSGGAKAAIAAVVLTGAAVGIAAATGHNPFKMIRI